jgi:uncharacterized membrane protein YbhN (UPF0104 family)
MTAISDEPAAIAPLLPDRRRLGLRLALVAGVLGGLALAVSSLPGLDEVRDRLDDASAGWIALGFVLQAGSCLAFIAVFRGVYSRRLPWRTSLTVGLAAQGTNALLPAGGASGLALGALALRRTGLPDEQLARRTVALYVLTSAVNFFTAALAGGLLALGILGGGTSLVWTAGPALLAALTIAAVLVAPRLLRGVAARPRDGRLGRLLGAGSAALADGVDDARHAVRGRNAAAIAGAIGYMTLDLAALAAAFAAIGSMPPIGVLMLAYVIGQLGGLIPVPGGVGGADGGLIAALVLYGTPLGAAAAAVLAYRVFQLGLPAVLGAIALIRLPAVLERAPDLSVAVQAPRAVREPVAGPARADRPALQAAAAAPAATTLPGCLVAAPERAMIAA